MAQHKQEIVLSRGEWLAHRYDETADCFQLRYLTRAAHDAATFITDEYLGIEAEPQIVDRRQAISKIEANPNLHFILHSAFCASTMMARGFNLPGVSMGLKEPVVLNDIVGWRRRGAAPAQVAERLDHTLHMLARQFEGDSAIVVKPSNVFNALAPVALTMRQNSKAILLFAPLPQFLVSVARKGLWCRLWCRELLEGLLIDGMVDLGFEMRDYFRQSDLQVAAIGWLAQHRLFHQMTNGFGSQRIATLDSEQLTARPEASVLAAAQFFGLDVDEAQLDGHPAFSTHSKFGGAFGITQRKAEQAAAVASYGDEIDLVLQWAVEVAKNAGISMELPNPLLQSS